MTYAEAEGANPVEEGSLEEAISIKALESEYPWRVLYKDCRILFCCHHALLDGAEACDLLKTLLYYLCSRVWQRSNLNWDQDQGK